MRLPARACLRLHLAVATILLAASTSRAAAPEGRLRILTSFLPIHSVAAAVAGTRADVENWLPPNVDPHEFQFSPRDLARLRAANVLVTAGLGLEGWDAAQLRRLSGNPGLRVIEAASFLPPNELIHDSAPHSHGGDDHDDHAEEHSGPEPPDPRGVPNPHFWLDPVLVSHVVAHLATAFAELDPEGAEAYSENARVALERLDRLHREFQEGLAEVADVPFVTYHNAFPYLARRYKLRMVGVVESSPGEGLSARRLSELSERIRRENVRVLFTDGQPTRMARRLVRDLRLQMATLETLETGQAAPGAYEAGMRRNLQSLRTALATARQP